MGPDQTKSYVSYEGPTLENGWRHGEGVCIYHDGARYEGDFVNDRRQGKGCLYYPDGSRLVGDFRDDEANGEGVLYFKNGDRYEGQFKDGKIEGSGTFNYEEDKRKYVGQFKQGLKHGKGEYYFPNGSRYIGEFVEDVKHGEGVFYYADGSRYEGTFQRGKREGHGKYFYANGDSYEGQFKADKKCGHGTERYSSGHVYIGQFKDGRRHGQGSFFYKDGGRYVGEHAYDKADGKGKEYYKDGGRYEGTFKKGEKHGHGVFYYPDDSRYDGEFRKNKRDGEGVYYYSNGNRYEGQWVDNLRSGQGTLYYADGGKYEGYFKNDKMNGRGIMSYADGKRYEVEYELGVEIRRRPLVQRREELRRRLLKKMELKAEGRGEEKEANAEQHLAELEEAAHRAYIELLRENELALAGDGGGGAGKKKRKHKDKERERERGFLAGAGAADSKASGPAEQQEKTSPTPASPDNKPQQQLQLKALPTAAAAPKDDVGRENRGSNGGEAKVEPSPSLQVLTATVPLKGSNKKTNAAVGKNGKVTQAKTPRPLLNGHVELLSEVGALQQGAPTGNGPAVIQPQSTASAETSSRSKVVNVASNASSGSSAEGEGVNFPLRTEVSYTVVGVKTKAGRKCKACEIKARAEADDGEVTIRFDMTPADTNISKFLVLCQTPGGTAIKSKKVEEPVAVLKGLTNGEKHVFVVAVLDKSCVRYDAPTPLCVKPGPSQGTPTSSSGAPAPPPLQPSLSSPSPSPSTPMPPTLKSRSSSYSATSSPSRQPQHSGGHNGAPTGVRPSVTPVGTVGQSPPAVIVNKSSVSSPPIKPIISVKAPPSPPGAPMSVSSSSDEDEEPPQTPSPVLSPLQTSGRPTLSPPFTPLQPPQQPVPQKRSQPSPSTPAPALLQPSVTIESVDESSGVALAPMRKVFRERNPDDVDRLLPASLRLGENAFQIVVGKDEHVGGALPAAGGGISSSTRATTAASNCLILRGLPSESHLASTLRCLERLKTVTSRRAPLSSSSSSSSPSTASTPPSVPPPWSSAAAAGNGAAAGPLSGGGMTNSSSRSIGGGGSPSRPLSAPIVCAGCIHRNLVVEVDSFALDRPRARWMLLMASLPVVLSVWMERHPPPPQASSRRREEDLARRLRIAVQVAHGLKTLMELGATHRAFTAESVVMDGDMCQVAVLADQVEDIKVSQPLPQPHAQPQQQPQQQHPAKRRGLASVVAKGKQAGAAVVGSDIKTGDGGVEAVKAGRTLVAQLGRVLYELFGGPGVQMEQDDHGDKQSSDHQQPVAAGGALLNGHHHGGGMVGEEGVGYLDEVIDLRAVVMACCQAEERGLGLDDALSALSRLALMCCPKVAIERVEKAPTGGPNGWTLQPRRLDMYISPGAVKEIITRLQSLPDARPYSLWTPKVYACLAMALEAYKPWVAAMMSGVGGQAQVEALLSTLAVAVPRAFCEATSKALIAALDLPFLFTSFEAFKHVRDRLKGSGRETQQRLSCINTLLYLRQLGAGEVAPSTHHHDKGQPFVTESAPPLLQLPTSLAEEVLSIFTDIYRTILALGFDEVSSFDALLATVKSASPPGPRTLSPTAARGNKLFLEGLGTEP